MGRITSSGCARNDQITRDEVECDPVVSGAATRRDQGSHGQGKVSENQKKFKVREKSGNFELSQGNLKFWKKSGKSQGIL